MWLLLFAVAFGILLVLPNTGGELSGTVAFIVEFAIVGALFGMEVYKSRAELFRRGLALLKRPLAFGTLAFIGIKLLHDMLSQSRELGLASAANNFALAACLIAYFLLLTLSTQLETGEKFVVLGMGIALFAVINIVGYKLGFSSPVGPSGKVEALHGTLDERMVAPFGGGLNTFGYVAVLGAAINLLAAWWSSKSRQFRFLSYSLPCALGCMAGVYLVQMRSAVIVLLFCLVYIAMLRSLRPWMAFGSVVIMLLIPIVLSSALSGNVMNLLPEKIVEMGSRNESEMANAGGRTPIYDYGWEIIFSGKTGIFGQGIAERDSGIAVSKEEREAFAQMSFHNGTLELLIVYGPFLGTFALLLLCVALAWQLLVRKRLPSLDAELALGVLACLVCCSFTEAFAQTNLFWGITVLVLAELYKYSRTRMIGAAPKPRRPRPMLVRRQDAPHGT